MWENSKVSDTNVSVNLLSWMLMTWNFKKQVA